MKYLLFISFIASCAFAETQNKGQLSAKHLPTQVQVQGSEKAVFIYREFMANREDAFIIQSTKCNGENTNELWVEKFETKTKVVNGETNTIHIYARSKECQESKLNTLWSQAIKIPKSKNVTQVYITILSNNIKVL
jgi:hypothetical protein